MKLKKYILMVIILGITNLIFCSKRAREKTAKKDASHQNEKRLHKKVKQPDKQYLLNANFVREYKPLPVEINESLLVRVICSKIGECQNLQDYLNILDLLTINKMAKNIINKILSDYIHSYSFDTFAKNYKFEILQLIAKELRKDEANRIDLNIIEFYSQAINNVNQQDVNGYTALMYAAKFGHLKILEFLIEIGADIQITNSIELSKSSLLYAAENGNLDIIKLLINKGAVIDICDSNNANAAIYAYLNQHYDIVKFLIEINIDLNVYDSSISGNILDLAVENNHLEFARLFLEEGIEINPEALFEAIVNHNIPMATLLIQNGADLNHINDLNLNCLMYAIDFDGAPLEDNHEMVKFLLEHGIDVNYTNTKGVTALQLAIKQQHIETIGILLLHGAQISDDKKYITLARETKNKNVIDIIENATASKYLNL